MYLVNTPWWLRALYPSFVWKINREDKVLYLTFDDGPHPTATPFVLDELKKYNAKATFFCIGKNVAAHRNIYNRILNEEHAIGNHTYNHVNGWKTNDDAYLKDIEAAAELIDSNLFRPPYGRMTKFQAKILKSKKPNTKVIMWDVLSGDFDTTINGEKCLKNIIMNADKGSILLFHDSTKAWERMSYALPRVLDYYTEKGYVFKTIPY